MCNLARTSALCKVPGIALNILRTIQGLKLTVANLQNASDFDNLRVRKISFAS